MSWLVVELHAISNGQGNPTVGPVIPYDRNESIWFCDFALDVAQGIEVTEPLHEIDLDSLIESLAEAAREAGNPVSVGGGGGRRRRRPAHAAPHDA